MFLKVYSVLLYVQKLQIKFTVIKFSIRRRLVQIANCSYLPIRSVSWLRLFVTLDKAAVCQCYSDDESELASVVSVSVGPSITFSGPSGTVIHFAVSSGTSDLPSAMTILSAIECGSTERVLLYAQRH